jgi:hypothetical protein
MRRPAWPIPAICLALGLPFPAVAAAPDLAACLSAPTRDCLSAVALDRADAMPADNDRSSLLAAAAVEQARDGSTDAAQATFARALDAAGASPEPLHRVELLMTIARMQAQADRIDDARATLKIAADGARTGAGQAGDWSTRLRAIADRQAELGDPAGAAASLAAAAASAAAISDPFQRGSELMLTASRQAALAADPATALSTFAAAKAVAADMSDAELRAGMLLSVAQTELEAGLSDPGLQSLRKAQAAAGILPLAAARHRLEATIALVLLKHMSP